MLEPDPLEEAIVYTKKKKKKKNPKTPIKPDYTQYPDDYYLESKEKTWIWDYLENTMGDLSRGRES